MDHKANTEAADEVYHFQKSGEAMGENAQVRSPSDSWTEMFTKVGEYLRAGIRAVVILDKETVTAAVYHPQTFQQTFHAADTLTVPEILPGFSVLVGTLFE